MNHLQSKPFRVLLLCAICAFRSVPAAQTDCDYSLETKLLAADGQAGDWFGFSIGISGDTVVVGARWDDDNGSDAGSAYVYERTGLTSPWLQTQKLLASDGSARDAFGRAVAIAGDTIIVSARFDDDTGQTSGSAYVFERSGPGAPFVEVQKLLASDGDLGNWFGHHVALEDDVLVLGAPEESTLGPTVGAAYVFERAGAGAPFIEMAKLLPATGSAAGEFGYSTAVSSGVVVIGAYKSTSLGQNSGDAHVFEKGPMGWVQTAVLSASDGAVDYNFGADVATSGTTIMVGSTFRTLPASPAPITRAGAVYVFEKDSTGAWSEKEILTASDPADRQWFAYDLAISGNTAVVGAWGDDDTASNGGAAYIFRRVDDSAPWLEVSKVTAPDGAAEDQLGVCTDIDGGTVIASAGWDDDNGLDSGSLYTFDSPFPGIATVSSAISFQEGLITATGTGFDPATVVSVDGVPKALLSLSNTSLSFQPGPSSPGFSDLVVTNFCGSTPAPDSIARLPSLTAVSGGPGGQLTVELNNGVPGQFVLAVGLSRFALPQTISSPPTWFGLLLDPTGGLVILSDFFVTSSLPLQMGFPIPPAPGLQGLTLHLQAWCELQGAGLGGGSARSFTNLVSPTI